MEDYDSILHELKVSPITKELWKSYQRKNSYVAGIEWDDALNAARNLCVVALPSHGEI